MLRKKKKNKKFVPTNKLSIPRREIFINQLAQDYYKQTQLISNEIIEIKMLLHRVDPLQLMNFLTTMDYFSSMMMGSEIEYDQEQILQNRTVEYIQSLLVSNAVELEQTQINEEEQEKYFFEIQTKTIELYKSIQQWYLYWSAYAEKELGLDSKDIEYIIESQLFSLVRGKRYQFQMEEHLTTLIVPLDKILRDKYDISSIVVIEGLLNIEKILTRGRGEAAEAIHEFMFNNSLNMEHPDEKSIEKGQDLFDSFFGVASNDVKKITHWPDRFIKDLSLSIGESDNFIHEEYCYWPILSSPIERNPFIELSGRYYCFSYYNLFDNIYRSLQKILSSYSQKEKDYWEQVQKETSENAVADLFEELLPECNVYLDNYYPEKESLRRMSENDILIEYENSLLVIEVKAGAFSPAPALLNPKSHLKSYKSLVEKADQQCQRTLSYLQRKDCSKIYDKEKNIKTTFSMNDYDYIYTICVTIDDFNEFAAKAEKLNQINISMGTIVLSIDDLRTYKDYFDSPLIFLNFLENRKNATSVPELRLTDELDHLGMYIEHNMYPLTFRDVKKNTIVQAFGYRQAIDDYFMSIWTSELIEKPERNLDYLRARLLSILNQKEMNNKLILSNFLLDFSTEGAENFVDSISYLKERQIDLNRMVTVISAGEDIRYVLFLEQPTIEKISIKQMRKYCDGMVAYGEYSELLMIYLIADSDLEIIDLQFEVRTQNNIDPNEMESLIEYGRETFETKRASMLNKMRKKKIGRNDSCPCGSGLKYKRCCGK